jgi:hypothetical protein
MITKWWFEDVEGSCRGLIWRGVPAFAWRNWRKLRKIRQDSRSRPRFEPVAYRMQVGSVTAWASVHGDSTLIILLNRTASPLHRFVNRNDSKAGSGCEALFPLLNVRPSNELHGAEHFLRSHRLLSYSKISQHFMETEGSLPCSREPSTGPYPESD